MANFIFLSTRIERWREITGRAKLSMHHIRNRGPFSRNSARTFQRWSFILISRQVFVAAEAVYRTTCRPSTKWLLWSYPHILASLRFLNWFHFNRLHRRFRLGTTQIALGEKTFGPHLFLGARWWYTCTRLSSSIVRFTSLLDPDRRSLSDQNMAILPSAIILSRHTARIGYKTVWILSAEHSAV